nr:hypothetical protein Iba_chr14cCG1040 [Ipomoea batatas]GMD87925.1 hypothetical protein Iba_chr14cCG2090 [Ipomoea batatas]
MPLPRSTTTADTALASATADDGDSTAKPAAADDDDPSSDLPDLSSRTLAGRRRSPLCSSATDVIRIAGILTVCLLKSSLLTVPAAGRSLEQSPAS